MFDVLLDITIVVLFISIIKLAYDALRGKV